MQKYSSEPNKIANELGSEQLRPKTPHSHHKMRYLIEITNFELNFLNFCFQPKHPQSLLKQPPLLLMTTTIGSTTTLQQQQQQQQVQTSGTTLTRASVLNTTKLLTAHKEQQPSNELVIR